MAEIDSKKRAITYSLLAHISNNGNLAKGSIDIFVPIVKKCLQNLYNKGISKNDTIAIIAEQIFEDYAIDIPIPVLRSILGKIANELNTEKIDFALNQDDSFWIQDYIFEDYDEAINESEKDVETINKLYKVFCESKGITNTTNIFDFFDKNRIEVSFYLANKDKVKNVDDSIAAQFVEYFRERKDIYEIFRSLYLGSFLVSYLEYVPMRAQIDVTLLLDTNFIISLFDLNTPESTKTCETLFKICKNLGYKFEILKDTIEEIQGLLNYKSAELNTSILSKSINKEDILNACERRKLTSVDLERISDNIVDRIERDFQIHIIPNTEKLKNKAKLDNCFNLLKEIRNTNKSALHDAMAFLYVKETRGKLIKDFEKVNCWFLNNSITHNSEYERQDILYQNNGSQPISIKADDLLNILWLSNPNIKISNDDFVDIGINSLVSFSLNASLPKARIIKELDENIQKYKDDFSITDKDVYYLSTRITNKQILDVNSLNESAKEDPSKFAKQVKEFASEQAKIEEAQASKMEVIIKSLLSNIDSVKKESSRLKNKEEELFNKEAEAKKTEAKNLELIKVIRNSYEDLKKQRKEKKDNYIKSKIDRWHTNAIVALILGIILIISSIVSFFYFEIGNKYIWVFRFILGIIVYLSIKHWYSVYFNPSYKQNFIKNIHIPAEFEEISFEEYFKLMNYESPAL